MLMETLCEILTSLKIFTPVFYLMKHETRSLESDGDPRDNNSHHPPPPCFTSADTAITNTS